MKYAHIEEITGEILGWYDKEIHCFVPQELDENGKLIKDSYYDLSKIPTPKIEVDELQYIEIIKNNLNAYEEESGTFIFKDFRTESELQIAEHENKSNEVDTYVNNLVITTASGKLFKANYSALTSMDIILKGDYPDGIIPIWKQNINGELKYYENVSLNELSEVVIEANKRIQAKHAEVFLDIPNPYND